MTVTAVFPSRTDYDKQQESGVWREYVSERNLDADGADTLEWVKSYGDGAGRQYKTGYPDVSYSQSWYN